MSASIWCRLADAPARVLRRGLISSSRHADQRPSRLALKDVLGVVPAVPRFIRHDATIGIRDGFQRRRTVADIQRRYLQFQA